MKDKILIFLVIFLIPIKKHMLLIVIVINIQMTIFQYVLHKHFDSQGDEKISKNIVRWLIFHEVLATWVIMNKIKQK